MSFPELARRLDALEDIADDWIGGGPRALSDVIAVAEAEAMEATPSTEDDRAWLLRAYACNATSGRRSQGAAAACHCTCRVTSIRALADETKGGRFATSRIFPRVTGIMTDYMT